MRSLVSGEMMNLSGKAPAPLLPDAFAEKRQFYFYYFL
jgi:hypothetical protein